MERGTTQPPVLVLGGAGVTALGVIRSLGRARIPLLAVCPRNELQARSRWYRQAPLLGDRNPVPSELAAYLAGLAINRAVLIPCGDDWVKAASALPDELKDRYPASIPGPKTIGVLTNKWLFAETVERLGIPRPRTILLRSIEQMRNLSEACYENTFLKPIASMEFCERNKVKAFPLKSKAHALELMGNRANEFPILLQEYITGPPTNYYLVDGFVDRERRIRALIARRRLRMYPVDFGNSTLSETVSLHEVKGAVETLEYLWSELEYRGIFDAEFKYDPRDGRFKIIEVNARPWWHIGFVARCGVDLCRMSYLDALGLPFKSANGYPVGRRVAFLASDFRAYRAMDAGLSGFLPWMRSWVGAYDAVYSSQDLWPGIWSTLQWMKYVCRARTG
jgi:predicted ATP-grasp superfamily ATP-dependent carboligase